MDTEKRLVARHLPAYTCRHGASELREHQVYIFDESLRPHTRSMSPGCERRLFHCAIRTRGLRNSVTRCLIDSHQLRFCAAPACLAQTGVLGAPKVMWS